MSGFELGVVADDFTGASDAASFMVQGGLETVLFTGVPEAGRENIHGARAVVIALKTRTMEREQAVEESMEAFRWLRKAGARCLYFKYCSTFDSTPEGNIGPVADAVMEELGIPYTLLCPSLPVNGRTVRDGALYVNGLPLHESHMRNHPLTPMWDCRISELMRGQSRYPCVAVDENGRIAGLTRGVPETNALCPAAGKNGIDAQSGAFAGANAKLEELAARWGHLYAVPDYETDGQGQGIARAFSHLPFLTGGSGLAGALSRVFTDEEEKNGSLIKEPRRDGTPGRAILMAGSCSAMTRRQVQAYLADGGFGVRLVPEEIVAGAQSAETVWEQIRDAGRTPLVYSSAAPEDVLKSQQMGRERVAQAIEGLFAGLAVRAVEAGWTRVISAGGETSGAVTRALGCVGYRIGDSVAPGVPVMTPLDRPELRLILKSGNFGAEDFFERALRLTEGGERDNG